jgi:hypothetical protein
MEYSSTTNTVESEADRRRLSHVPCCPCRWLEGSGRALGEDSEGINKRGAAILNRPCRSAAAQQISYLIQRFAQFE